MTSQSALVYFSSASENTHRFVEKLGVDATRIPLHTGEAADWRINTPFILLTPTYGGERVRHAVPRQIAAALNVAENRTLIRAVIGTGNTNFGTTFCLAARLIAAKCGIPLLYRLELLGTTDDVNVVSHGLETDQWPQP